MPNWEITGYEVRYWENGGGQNGTLTDVVLTSTELTELTGLKPGTTYRISVLAINGASENDGRGVVAHIQGTTLVTRKLSSVCCP